jgi:hypothetical protein
MSVMMKILSGVALAASMALGATAVKAQGAEFDGTNFTCLQYTSSMADNSSTKAQGGLAKTWVMGYLAGFYKAADKLQVVEEAKAADAIAGALAAKCKEAPQGTIWAVAGFLAGDTRKIPKMASDSLDLNTYTCAAHTDAKAGSAAEMMKADLADLWAFAFIQGYKNFTDKEMVINMENKPVLTGAVSRNCSKMRDKTFIDLTGMVAQAVKLGG